MPVNTTITSQKFFSQFRNGEDWLSSPLDFTQWLLGSTGEKLRVETNIQIKWDTGNDGSPNDGFSGSGNTLTRQAGDFILDDGFSLGDTAMIYVSGGSASSPNVMVAGVITYLDATTCIFDSPLLITGNYSWIRMRGISDLEGNFFKYGLIQNVNESINYDSKIDFSEQAYSINGLVNAGVGVPLTMNEQDSATIKSWINGQVTCQYDGESNFKTIKSYKIIHEFYVLPYFVDGWLQNIQNNTLPTLFGNGNSLKYVFDANFRKTINNPNENKSVIQSNVQGSVGWFEQNFNGFANKFFMENLVKTEVSSGNATDSIIVTSKTRFTFDIRNNVTNWVGTEPVIVGISYLPELGDYTNPDNTVIENFLLDSKRAVVGGGAASSTIVKDLTVVLPAAGNILNVSVDFEYSAAQQAILDSSKYYVVWVLTGSDASTFTVNKSNALDDRVPLFVDFDQYIKNPDVPNLIRGNVESLFYRHYRDYTIDGGRTDVKGWIEDGYLWKLRIDKPVDPQSKINSAAFKLVAFKAADNTWFTIQQYTFDVIPNKLFVPNPFNLNVNNEIITIDSTRGYNLEATDQFNFAKWETRPITTNSIEIYDVLIGFKLNWEEWLALQGVDPLFYDPSNIYGNNGFNKELTHLQANGYTIRALLDMDIESSDGAITNYVISSPDFDVQDYCEDGGDKAEWTCNIATRNEDSTASFGGLIKTDENTRIKATFTPTTYAAGLTYFAVIRLDDELGSEFSIRELSSMTTTPNAFNPASPISELIPLSGETGALITDTGAKVTVECLIDHTKIQKGKCYKISARLWREGIGEFPGGDPIVKSQDSLPIVLSQAPWEEIKTS